jgi:hypothetical protein
MTGGWGLKGSKSSSLYRSREGNDRSREGNDRSREGNDRSCTSFRVQYIVQSIFLPIRSSVVLGFVYTLQLMFSSIRSSVVLALMYSIL